MAGQSPLSCVFLFREKCGVYTSGAEVEIKNQCLFKIIRCALVVFKLYPYL